MYFSLYIILSISTLMNIETFDFSTSNDVKSTGIIEFEDI